MKLIYLRSKNSRSDINIGAVIKSICCLVSSNFGEWVNSMWHCLLKACKTQQNKCQGAHFQYSLPTHLLKQKSIFDKILCQPKQLLAGNAKAISNNIMNKWIKLRNSSILDSPIKFDHVIALTNKSHDWILLSFEILFTV